MGEARQGATVTQPSGKPGGWNEVNPTSEKLKFGRGIPRFEMKDRGDAQA